MIVYITSTAAIVAVVLTLANNRRISLPTKVALMFSAVAAALFIFTTLIQDVGGA